MFLLNTQSTRNISKKKQRNHTQLKDQENSPEGMNNETDLFSLIDTEFKKEVMKILKELRKVIDRNAECCKKDLEIMRSQEKLENSFAKTKAELKAMNHRMNNEEERISDLKDRIMEITQSKQQTESQAKK